MNSCNVGALRYKGIGKEEREMELEEGEEDGTEGGREAEREMGVGGEEGEVVVMKVR